MPEYTASTNAIGTLRLLEAIRAAGLDCRFYQASTSEMFGSDPAAAGRGLQVPPALAVRRPRSSQAHWVTVNYREAYGLFAVSRDPVQPRVAAARRELRDPQDHQGRGGDRGRRDGPRGPGQPRRRPRLGLRTGVRRGHVADAAARRAGRLRARDRRRATPCATSARPRSPTSGSTGPTTSGSTRASRAPPRCDALIGNPDKAHRELGWKAEVTALDLARLMVDADREEMAALPRPLRRRVRPAARVRPRPAPAAGWELRPPG